MKLYNFFRSSASHRVRIALNLKGLPYDYVPVHLVRGEQDKPEYMALNPQGLVPALLDGERLLTQSLAIIEYLDETHPQPLLLPKTPAERAKVRSLALLVACEIHPFNNRRTLNYLTDKLKLDKAAKNAWYCHWVVTGLTAFEARLRNETGTGRFCHGDTPGLADCCLVPQVVKARESKCDISGCSEVLRIYNNCMALETFIKAEPSNQPDAE